jgi:hypothetical protein
VKYLLELKHLMICQDYLNASIYNTTFQALSLKLFICSYTKFGYLDIRCINKWKQIMAESSATYQPDPIVRVHKQIQFRSKLVHKKANVKEHNLAFC